MSSTSSLDHLKSAVVRVGPGRGFVIDLPGAGRVVVTAAHCLPHVPPAMTFSLTDERTYADLVGPVGERPSMWAECLFVDPVADLAVLAAPDGQECFDQCEAFEAFIEARDEVFSLGVVADAAPVNCWVLSLDGEWIAGIATAGRLLRMLQLSDVQGGIAGGMSGSPVVNERGEAIGVVSTGMGWAQTVLAAHLPAWMVTRRDGT